MVSSPAPNSDVEIDFRALTSVVWKRWPYILLFVVVVAAGVYVTLSRIAPVYKSEATLLITPGESDLTRSAQSTTDTTAMDQQAITSQVQLIRSRDLAQAVATRLNLAAKPEFDPKSANPSVLSRALSKLGVGKSESTLSVDDRVLGAYFRKLTVFAVENSRIINIDFASTDPKLAADAANAIAEEYLAQQSAALHTTTADAAQWLSDQIVDLRQKVQTAEARVEDFRSGNDLFDAGGTTPTTLPQQQLADLNTELSKVRAERADAESKAAQIRAGLALNTVPNMVDVLNSPLIQNLVGQEVALRSQIAQLNATLLPGHPKMKELNAQVGDLDQQILGEARKILESVDAESKATAAREGEINDALTKMKATTATANDAGVELRALEREAAAERDLLATYLSRYREAVGREQTDYLPPDARIVSRAAVATDPDFPKKIPMTSAATAAALILAVAFLLLRELASGRPMRRINNVAEPLPVVPDAVPVSGHTRWADDHSVRRMMPSEPTLAPEMVDRVEDSLRAIAAQIVKAGEKRVLVTLAEGSDSDGRPLGAVALSRALARTDARVVLVDFRDDGADARSMGEGADLPGFADLFDGDASFAQVIFRDRKSRVHFIPAGKKPLNAGLLDPEHLETMLAALTLTYDFVLIDTGDEMIATFGPSCGMAMVVSEFAAADPRTIGAFDRVSEVSDAEILLLVVDPAPIRPEAGEVASVSAGEAA